MEGIDRLVLIKNQHERMEKICDRVRVDADNFAFEILRIADNLCNIQRKIDAKMNMNRELESKKIVVNCYASLLHTYAGFFGSHNGVQAERDTSEIVNSLLPIIYKYKKTEEGTFDYCTRWIGVDNSEQLAVVIYDTIIQILTNAVKREAGVLTKPAEEALRSRVKSRFIFNCWTLTV